jgi:hypothetical protein
MPSKVPAPNSPYNNCAILNVLVRGQRAGNAQTEHREARYPLEDPNLFKSMNSI